MSHREVNFQVLSNPKSSRYFHELKRSPMIVASHQLQQYYSILISSINLNENTKEVFKALCKSLLINDKNLDYFISENFIDKISVLDQPILNLIYILVSRSPNSITTKTIYIISKKIASFPREILYIIALYTEKIKDDLNQNKIIYEENSNYVSPWTIFEIAIQNSNLFMNLLDESTNYNTSVDYVTLLSYIFDISISSNILTQEKLDSIWSIGCSMLSSYNKDAVIASYSLLNFISDKVSSYSKLNLRSLIISSFPLETIILHLKQKKEFSRYAISLMLHFPPPNVNDTLLNSLIDLASGSIDENQNQKEEVQIEKLKEPKVKSISAKSKLILMQIANDEHNCKSLIYNSKWMVMDGLPTFTDVLTLFLICLSQKEYRELLFEESSKNDDLINENENHNAIVNNIVIFFNNLLNKIPSDEILGVICTIIKRISLTEQVMKRLSKSGFFTDFFNRSLENKSIVNVQVGLIALHYVSKICYINEFDQILGNLVRLVGSGEKVSSMAATACIELCKYEQCLDSLKRLDFANVLSQNLQNHEFQQILKKFKKLSKSSDDS